MIRRENLVLTLMLGAAIALLGFSAYFANIQKVQGYATNTDNCPTASAYIEDTLLTATTTTATSTNLTGGGGSVSLACAKKVTAFFSRGGMFNPNTGSTNFRLQVSSDGGTTWHYFNRMMQNVATSTGVGELLLDSVTISAATSTIIVGLDLANFAFDRIRCITIETTDGEHTCKIGVEY